jgi:hypothetical protein
MNGPHSLLSVSFTPDETLHWMHFSYDRKIVQGFLKRAICFAVYAEPPLYVGAGYVRRRIPCLEITGFRSQLFGSADQLNVPVFL